MSSYIEDIIQTEEAAGATIANAREEAKQRIEAAREQAKHEHAELLSTLQKERAEKLKAQKDELVQLYRKTLGKSESEAEELRKQASANKKRAVEHVVKNIVR